MFKFVQNNEKYQEFLWGKKNTSTRLSIDLVYFRQFEIMHNIDI